MKDIVVRGFWNLKFIKDRGLCYTVEVSPGGKKYKVKSAVYHALKGEWELKSPQPEVEGYGLTEVGCEEVKMKKVKVSSLVFAIAIIFSGLLAVQAGAFGPPPPGGGIPPLEALLELDLSDSQKVEVLNIINKYREEEMELNAQLQAAREETKDVLQAETFDEEKVRLAFRQISPIMENIMVLKTKIMAELKAVLNSDQLKLLEEKREERFKRMEEGMQLGE